MNRLVFALTVLAATSAKADLVLDFRSAAAISAFDNDVIGDTGGPFLDPMTGISATFTTRGFGGAGTAVNVTASSSLGVIGGTNNDRFDPNESWSFDADVDLQLTSIDFRLFGAGEQFTLTSTAWATSAFTPPTGGPVSFSSDGTTGTFVFSDNGSTDIFSLADLTGSGSIDIAVGTDLTLTFLGTGTDNATLDGLTFATISSVPEPSSLAFGLLLGLGCCASRRRRR